MSKQEKTTIIFSIALFYTVIISIFSFFLRMNVLLVRQGDPILWFMLRNTLWIIAIVAIIFVLYGIISKDSKKEIRIIVAEKPIVGFATGILVTLEGISQLASTIPTNIMSITAAIETSQLIEGQGIIFNTIISNILGIAIIIGQIVLGFYLIKTHKKRLS
jgi:hypothetical protein